MPRKFTPEQKEKIFNSIDLISKYLNEKKNEVNSRIKINIADTRYDLHMHNYCYYIICENLIADDVMFVFDKNIEPEKKSKKHWFKWDEKIGIEPKKFSIYDYADLAFLIVLNWDDIKSEINREIEAQKIMQERIDNAINNFKV